MCGMLIKICELSQGVLCISLLEIGKLSSFSLLRDNRVLRFTFCFIQTKHTNLKIGW